MLPLCSPMLALEMLSPIAVTETTEVGTGWGGVRPTRSAAGAAALITFGYYRRPPARARADPGAGARIVDWSFFALKPKHNGTPT